MRREIPFRLRADFAPAGDQPEAIAALAAGLRDGHPHQVLLGVTGSGQDLHGLERDRATIGKPTLVIAPEQDARGAALPRVPDVLSRQRRALLRQLLRLLPARGVRPLDRHVHREGRLHQRRDRQDAPRRHARRSSSAPTSSSWRACRASTVSASPASYFDMLVVLERGDTIERDALLRKLVDMPVRCGTTTTSDRGTFRVRGDVVEIYPAYEEARAIRVELFGDTVEALCRDRSAARHDVPQDRPGRRSIPRATTSRPRRSLKRAVDGIRDRAARTA